VSDEQAMGRAFSPRGIGWAGTLGLRPRLVWDAPLALTEHRHDIPPIAIKPRWMGHPASPVKAKGMILEL